MSLESVFESSSMPFLVPGTDFGLDDPSENAKKLAELKKKLPLVLSTISLRDGTKAELFRSGSPESGTVFIEYRGFLGLYIKYESYHFSFLPIRTVTQTKLWRNPKLPVTNAFSHKLFFNTMLKMTGAVLSDMEHTSSGREFWMRRLGEALGKKLHVALVDFGSKTFEEVKSPAVLENLFETAWSADVMNKARYQQIRWLVWR